MTAQVRRDTDQLVADVADNMTDLVRAFIKKRQEMIRSADRDVEWWVHMVLRTLQNHGPMRAGALAEELQADPSTISRQVAAVVRDGLVRRQADPVDGRASLLVLTDQADAVLAEQQAMRNSYFATVLEGWDADELRTFADLLARFGSAYRCVAAEMPETTALPPSSAPTQNQVQHSGSAR